MKLKCNATYDSHSISGDTDWCSVVTENDSFTLAALGCMRLNVSAVRRLSVHALRMRKDRQALSRFSELCDAQVLIVQDAVTSQVVPLASTSIQVLMSG